MGFKQTSLMLLILCITAYPCIQGQASENLNSSKEETVSFNKEENEKFEKQIENDRRQQKLTKELKIRLEQANLELEHAKAMSQINQLRQANGGFFKDPITQEQQGLPLIKIDYIGGDQVKREAIISIGGTTYHVLEKSEPMPGLQVVSILDSSVKLHFTAPQELIKIIDYRPE